MQTFKIIMLIAIVGGLVATGVKADAADYIFFSVADDVAAGIDWQPDGALFKIQAPIKAITKAIEIHVDIVNDVPILPQAIAQTPVYELTVMSDQKKFSSPIEFLLPVNSAEGLGLWHWSNNKWELSWNFVVDGDRMFTVYRVTEPGEYKLLLARDMDKQFDLVADQDNFSTSLFTLKLPELNNVGTEVKLAHLPIGSVIPPAGLVSPIYQYSLHGFTATEIAARLVSITLPYYLSSYQGRDLVFWDKRLGEWRRVPSVNNIQRQTVTGRLPFTYAVVGLVENPEVYEGVSSWYAYKACDCAAARFWPKQTRLKVTNLANGRSKTVRVNDYGPEEWTGRLIDLDSTVFKSISQLWRGLINVRVEPV